MMRKIFVAVTTLSAALVCSFAFLLTALAEGQPVIDTREVVVSDKPQTYYDRINNTYHDGDTDEPIDGWFENHLYTLCYYQNGVGYTGTAIVNGEEWKFENGIALNGEYDMDDEPGNDTVYYDGKPITGSYTIFGDGNIRLDHVDSFTDKLGNVYEACFWCYAENGKFLEVDGWYGSEDYRRFYESGTLSSGWFQDGDKRDIPEFGKRFEKGLLFTGFMGDEKTGVQYYQDGERFTGLHQVTKEDHWYYDTADVIRKSYIFEVGKTYLFGAEQGGQGTLYSGFYEKDGALYWYENGLKQGMEGRGKEIYDPDTGAWYWLDAVDHGKVATNKDVYQESYAGAYADRPDGTGKWVRYDENGHMIKGWSVTKAGTYYFDPETGAMAKGTAAIDGKEYHFDENTGILSGEAQYHCVWVTIDGKDYWYENGVRQGYHPDNPSYRGKEIYDPASDAWYWLDNVQQGAKTVNKDVYQESYAGTFADKPDGTGKWVRYDENGQMIKGWHDLGNGKSYYFDPETGAMAKGTVNIEGLGTITFDMETGIRQW